MSGTLCARRARHDATTRVGHANRATNLKTELATKKHKNTKWFNELRRLILVWENSAALTSQKSFVFLCLFVANYCFFSTGRFSCCHKLNPPNNAAAFSIPFVLKAATAPADVCSAVQEQ
jgi:hypothetical protein